MFLCGGPARWTILVIPRALPPLLVPMGIGAQWSTTFLIHLLLVFKIKIHVRFNPQNFLEARGFGHPPIDK